MAMNLLNQISLLCCAVSIILNALTVLKLIRRIEDVENESDKLRRRVIELEVMTDRLVLRERIETRPAASAGG